MTAKGLSLWLGMLAWTSQGCRVDTCTGFKCEQLLEDARDASMDRGVGAPDSGGGGGDAGPEPFPPDAGLRDAASRPEPPESLTVTGFCRALAQTGQDWADRLDRCCTQEERASASAERLLALFGFRDTSVSECVAKYQQLIDTGLVLFDGASAAACAEALLGTLEPPPRACPMDGFDVPLLEATVAHGAPALSQLLECRRTMMGAKRGGDPCSHAFECAPRLTCRDDLSLDVPTRLCRAPLLAGRCAETSDCALGLVCIGDDTTGERSCRPADELSDGGPCRDSRECVPGQLCDASSRTCVVPAPEADPLCPAPVVPPASAPRPKARVD